MKRLVRTIAFGALALSATSAPAQDAYALVNDSSWYVTGFFTYEGGYWSDNWFPYSLAPGESADLSFGYDGDCEVFTRVTYENGDYAEGTIDYCGDGTIIVGDSGVYSQ